MTSLSRAMPGLTNPPGRYRQVADLVCTTIPQFAGLRPTAFEQR
jgi:hypothetical protein